MVLFSDLRLAPHPDPFRWKVSVTDPTGLSSHEPLASEPNAVEASRKVAPAIEPVHEPPRPTTTAPPPLQSASPRIKERRSVPGRESPPSPVSQTDVVPLNNAATESARTDVPIETPLLSPPAAPVEETRPNTHPSPDSQSSADAAATPPTAVPTEKDQAPMTSGLPPQSSIREAGPSSAKTDKPDFGWLTDSLRNKVKESQKYSTVARLNGLEGRVVLRITVKENGELLVAIAKSSGHDLLDQEALEQVKRLSPFPLSQPLGRAQQVLNLPITYSLNQ